MPVPFELVTAQLFKAPDSLESTNPITPILLPGIFLFFGALIYLGARYNDQKNDKRTNARWFGAGLVVLSLFLGFIRFMYTRDDMFSHLLLEAGRKFFYAYWAAFILPLLGAGTIVFLEWWDKKQREYIS
jgi:hypothetical protein